MELQVSEARNEALSAQLNPHFIFNSLNSINSYLAQNDNRAAMRYLGKFAKMMRNTFENSQHSYVSLQEELEAIKRYTEVESLRLQNEFDLEIILDDDVHPREIKIPSLILQPVVENCIWHGIAPVNDRRGIVHIHIAREGSEELIIQVRDNGRGIQKNGQVDRLDSKRKSSSEILKERFYILSRLSRKEHKLIMEANEDGEGVTVSLHIAIQNQTLNE